MEAYYRPIIDFLLMSRGIDISKYDPDFLKKTILKRMEDVSAESAEHYYAHLIENSIETEHFLQSLMISYTEFFRNPLTFATLEKIVIPSLVRTNLKAGRKELRVWSAACAAGQETYSIAMLLKEIQHGFGNTLNFRIFATDHSEKALAEASLGRYHPSAMNRLTLKRADTWFTRSGEMYEVKPGLKENIDFSLFDLFNKQYSCPPASIFGDFDMVFCANLLFYYAPEYRKIIISKATRCLTPNGYLITGESEREIMLQHGFREIFPHSAIFRKAEKILPGKRMAVTFF